MVVVALDLRSSLQPVGNTNRGLIGNFDLTWIARAESNAKNLFLILMMRRGDGFDICSVPKKVPTSIKGRAEMSRK